MNARQWSIAGALLVSGLPCLADPTKSAELPSPGFNSARYATLWTKSPFAIATPDAPAASADYQLVGMAEFDGVNYVSLVDKQNQQHFVLASDQPVRGLTLVSIAHGPSSSSAVIQRNGETLTLQEETAAAPPPGVAGINQAPEMPRPVAQPLSNVGGAVFPFRRGRPPVRIHRFPVNVPPPPP
jgi:hypothetical protein